MVTRTLTTLKTTGLLLFALLLPAITWASNWPTPPAVHAKSWAVIDARSGQIVASDNADEQLPPASLTKMMTLYLAFQDIKLGRLSLSEKVNVSNKAWKIGGSTMFLDPRMHPTVEQLLHGIATLSGNDACIALAEHVAGTEEAFVQRMNDKAKELGMTHTHFLDSTGFPQEGHYSTAHDMAILGAALWRDFPEHYEIFSEKSFAYKGHTQPNRNRLLWTYPGADGIKTGHTEEAGYCLVGSAQKGTTRFVTAVFGTDSDRARATESIVLLRYAFRNFVTLRPAERDIRRRVEVFEGEENQAWLKPAKPVWVTVPRGEEKELAFRLRYDAPLKAPIRKEQQIGRIEAVLGGKPGTDQGTVLTSVPMVAIQAVKRASWLGRQWDNLRLWWRGSDLEAATN